MHVPGVVVDKKVHAAAQQLLFGLSCSGPVPHSSWCRPSPETALVEGGGCCRPTNSLPVFMSTSSAVPQRADVSARVWQASTTLSGRLS